ncbi:protein phosphatase 1 regulatory subunit 17 [Protopterus annectens]|uniref:protein phosphatase 1 regulatory subunit 17 n=1 Tax=Protopterus annectens TaxID=7888 RepID=UPI001CFBD10C|nr:protein phosphatase 1 regulatory subunit 17 [Protopterus annectens]
MATECVQSHETPADRLENPLTNQLDITKLSKQLLKSCDVKEKVKDKTNHGSPNNGHEQKKPRRKDTPVLHMLPFVPGVKLLKEEKRIVFVEDEEKD